MSMTMLFQYFVMLHIRHTKIIACCINDSLKVENQVLTLLASHANDAGQIPGKFFGDLPLII